MNNQFISIDKKDETLQAGRCITTGQLAHQEQLFSLTVDAVAKARFASDQIFDVVVPTLPPQRRLIAERIKRGLEGDAFLTDNFLYDLVSLIAFLEREIAKGTHTSWIADDHDVHGGHQIRHFDTRVHALSCAAEHLSLLHEAISGVLNFARAARLVEGLILD